MTQRKSLREFHPKNIDIPLLLLTAMTTLIVGLCLPLVFVEKAILWKKRDNSYSVFTGVVSLWEEREYFLAAVIFFFSMVFPFAKLAALGAIWFFQMAQEKRQRLLRWLGVLGKWSMLDVFIVSILIVAVKLGPLVDVQPRPGVYFFGAAILLSMLTTVRVDWLAKKAFHS